MAHHDLAGLQGELTASLRLFEYLIGALHAPAVPGGERTSAAGELLRELREQPDRERLVSLLLRVRADTAAVLSAFSVGRAAIRGPVLERLRATHPKLDEVNATAENAVVELMNGVDRVLAHMETLDGECGAVAENVRAEMRGELFALYGHLQFQDITSQQLRGVAAQLDGVEEKLAAVAGMLDGDARTAGAPRPATTDDSVSLAFNPDATMRDVEARQRGVDDLLAGHRP